MSEKTNVVFGGPVTVKMAKTQSRIIVLDHILMWSTGLVLNGLRVYCVKHPIIHRMEYIAIETMLSTILRTKSRGSLCNLKLGMQG